MTDEPNTPILPTPPPLATLSDLECATITVVVSLADDSEVIVPLKLITQARMMELGATVPSPKAPVVDYAPGGKPVFDYTDAGYQAAMAKANLARNTLSLAEMLQLYIPGATTDEKAQYIREKFDPIVTQSLIGVVNDQIGKAKARVISRAETFHGG